MKRHLVILLLSFTVLHLNAQQYSGLKVGDYGGIYSIHSNPAAIRTSAYKWDLSIIGAGTDISNNLVELPKTSFISFLSTRSSQIENQLKIGVEDIDDIESQLGLHFLNHQNTRSHLDLEILGPGLMIQTDKISIGLYSKMRAFAHINDIPNFAQAIYIEDLNSQDVFTFPNSNFSYMDWREIGLTLSTSLAIDDYSTVHLGATIKKLDSYNMFFGKSNQDTQAIKLRDSIYLENANFEYALFSGVDYDEESASYTYDHQVRGSGYAMDIGFIYQWRQSKYSDKNHKIGISVSDIGFIDYNENGNYQHITIQDGYILKSKFLDENFITELQKELEIDDKIYISNTQNHSVHTPAILQAFYQFPLQKNWNVTVSVQERIPFYSPIERASIMMATAHYDHKWIGASFPVSLYNHQYVRLGAAARIGPLIIGTDNVIPIFLPTSLRAFNGYIALRINSEMFSFLKRKSFYKSPKSQQGSSKVKCYEF